ncbi:MAG: ABC transporter ATP-binding protein [Trueperaceae bacterium]
MRLELAQVSKKVGAETHLYDMSLILESGLNVLLGPTLAGKTSLMRLMAGLDRPATGSVSINGGDVTKINLRKRSVAFVYQQFINYPSLTVFENIASPLRVEGMKNNEIAERVNEMAEILHLEPFLRRLPSELSGGQQQRTALARALVKQADVLLLDEPLVNLDYKLREELREELRDIFAQRDAIVVYATTEPLEALMLGGRTAVLNEGKLLQFGETLEVYHRPAVRRVGEIFSDPPMNLVPVHVDNGHIALSGQVKFPLPEHMKSLSSGAYTLGLRVNHLGMSQCSAQDVVVPASVALAEINGSETYLHAEHEGVKMVSQIEGVHPFDLGQSVTLYLDPKRLYAFSDSGDLDSGNLDSGDLGSGKLVAAPVRAVKGAVTN